MVLCSALALCCAGRAEKALDAEATIGPGEPGYGTEMDAHAWLLAARAVSARNPPVLQVSSATEPEGQSAGAAPLVPRPREQYSISTPAAAPMHFSIGTPTPSVSTQGLQGLPVELSTRRPSALTSDATKTVGFAASVKGTPQADIPLTNRVAAIETAV
mmetsp:Transcript_19161/g.40754  ORF Transcript_19161/g.40754 Transcript_19161/m.40754 type:complete len:159 (+) Transcript_19161:75-551(+)